MDPLALCDPGLPVEDRVTDPLGRPTDEEKVGLPRRAFVPRTRPAAFEDRSSGASPHQVTVRTGLDELVSSASHTDRISPRPAARRRHPGATRDGSLVATAGVRVREVC